MERLQMIKKCMAKIEQTKRNVRNLTYIVDDLTSMGCFKAAAKVKKQLESNKEKLNAGLTNDYSRLTS